MAKIFSILTLLVAGVAIWFALEGKKRVEEMHKAGQATVTVLKTTETRLKSTEAELKKTQDELTSTKAELEKTKEDLRTTRADLDKAQGELLTTKKSLDEKVAQLADIQKLIQEVFPGKSIADGVNDLRNAITELTEKSKAQETKIAELEKTKANLDSQVAELSNTKTQQETKIAEQVVKIDKYQKNIMVKNTRGRVEAVNAGWGFCVISIGDKQGAANNKTLIVVRNGQSIGKVRITNVEATQSVADILPNTFLKGMFIQPGDGVIYTGEDKAQVDDAASAINPALPTHGPGQ